MRALADPAAPGRAAGHVASRWGDLRKRSLSAALLAPLALACVWIGEEWFALLVAMGAIGLGLEWASLCGMRPLAWPAYTVPLHLLVACVAAMLEQELAALLLLGAGAVLIWGASGRHVLAAGLLYVGVPLVALAWLRGGGTVGRADVVFLVLVVWASDIGAYVVGRMLGGPKLAPAISPGKTWSGAVGGLVIAMVIGEAAAHVLAPSAPGRAAAVAGVLGIASAAGDLLESWIKRRFGVKDSGRLIPGHGGLLDRLDGLLAAAPAAAVMALAMGREGVLWR